MLFTTTLKFALRNMRANKMRAGLSSLGIIIGVFSVLAILSLGEGAQNAILKQFSSLGVELITVSPGGKNSGDVRDASQSRKDFLTLDHAELINTLPHVDGVSPILSARKQVSYKGKNSNATITGIEPQYEIVNSAPVTNGSHITEEAYKKSEKVAVIGTAILENLFQNQNPIGETIQVDQTLFTVIGVAKAKGGPGGADNTIFIPLSTAQSSLIGKIYLSSISVKAETKDHIPAIEEAIQKALNRTLGVTDPGKSPFTVANQLEILETVNTITDLFKLFLSAVAAISLIVGGIGVMNILLVTVSERTKEIGIRKAIGAKSSDIIEQFLIESVLLTVLGGSIGIFLAYLLVSLIIALDMSFVPVIGASHILLALSFSVGTGIFFGIYPAYKAAKMRPIDALRSD